MKSPFEVDVDGVSYSIASPRDLHFVPVMMMNGMLSKLRLRCLGKGRAKPFLDVFRPLVWLGGRLDVHTLILFRIGSALPLDVRVNDAHGFNHRLEHEMESDGYTWWSVLTADASMQLLIPTSVLPVTQVEGG